MPSLLRPLCCLVLPLVAACAADLYDFTGKTRAYVYETRQEVSWASAGDRLRFTTAMTWKLVLKGRAPGEAGVTVLRVTARHEGPGTVRTVDSAADPGTDPDPLLGHLAGLEGVTFGLSVDPATGAVTRVTGTEAIAKRVAARVPDLVNPTGPSPIEDQARALYSPDHLAKLWTAVLALPGGPTRLPLAGIPNGTLVRTWGANGTWTASLAEGQAPVTLGQPPTQIACFLTDLKGGGTLTLANGLPEKATGDLTFTLRLTALTQPVESVHHLTWSMAPVL
jgi:hypothetical protein